MNFTDYAEKALQRLPNTKSAYLYKQEVIARMTERANELIKSGLSDNKVINELVISEFKDIEKEYYLNRQTGNKKAAKKRNASLSVLGIFGYTLLLVVLYLAVSFATGLWAKTWLILVAGILLPVAAGCVASAAKTGGKGMVRSFASRFLISCAIFLVATVSFLLIIIFTGIGKSWLIFLGAVVLCLITDSAMAFACRQKSAIITLVLDIPAIGALVYVILGVLGVVPWHPGWVIILISVIFDIAVIAAKIVSSSKREVEDEVWEDI